MLVGEEKFEPILQWRKISGDTPSGRCLFGNPYSSPKNGIPKHGGARHGQQKVSRQDAINEEARMRRKALDASKKDRVTRRGDAKKIHIVQNKKAQFTHLTSSQRVKPNDDQHQRPIVYDSSDKRDRQEVAALWLQPFTVVDDY